MDVQETIPSCILSPWGIQSILLIQRASRRGSGPEAVLFPVVGGIKDQLSHLSVHSSSPALSVYLLVVADVMSWRVSVAGEDLEGGALCVCACMCEHVHIGVHRYMCVTPRIHVCVEQE